MLLHLVFKEVSDDSSANSTQKTVIFLVSEVVTRRATSKGTPQTTAALRILALVGATAFSIVRLGIVCLRHIHRGWARTLRWSVSRFVGGMAATLNKVNLPMLLLFDLTSIYVLVSQILRYLSATLRSFWPTDRTEIIWLSYRRVASLGRIILISFRREVVWARLLSISVVWIWWRCRISIHDIAVWRLVVWICTGGLLARLIVRGIITDPTGSGRGV